MSTTRPTFRTRQSDTEIKEANKTYLVPDFEEAKVLWKNAKGDLRGMSVAWDAMYKRKAPTINELDDLIKQEQEAKKEGHTRPQLLENKQDTRVVEPNAFGLGRTKEGWVVMTYRIVGNKNVLVSQTKPEPKQFAVGRIQQLIAREIL